MNGDQNKRWHLDSEKCLSDCVYLITDIQPQI